MWQQKDKKKNTAWFLQPGGESTKVHLNPDRRHLAQVLLDCCDFIFAGVPQAGEDTPGFHLKRTKHHTYK